MRGHGPRYGRENVLSALRLVPMKTACNLTPTSDRPPLNETRTHHGHYWSRRELPH